MSTKSLTTWSAAEAAERSAWNKKRFDLGRMHLMPRSPFLPTTFRQWIDYREGCIADKLAKRQLEIQRARERQESSRAAEMNVPQARIQPAFGGRKYDDNLGAVLALPTIWTQFLFHPGEEETAHRPAMWPSADEMKEEGDERHTSGFRRFLALPRAPGEKHTIAWKLRSLIETYPMDRVWDLEVAQFPRQVPFCTCSDSATTTMTDTSEVWDDEKMEVLVDAEVMADINGTRRKYIPKLGLTGWERSLGIDHSSEKQANEERKFLHEAHQNAKDHVVETQLAKDLEVHGETMQSAQDYQDEKPVEELKVHNEALQYSQVATENPM